MELDKTRKRKQSSSNEQALDDTKVPKLIDTASSSNSNEFIENEKNISSHVEIENMDTEITTREKQTSVGNQDGNNKRNQEVFVEEQQQLYEEAVNGCSSNMRKILENWKKHISNEELEDRVLDLYTELKLNNIPLVEEVEMFIYEFLLKRCFLQQTSTTSFKIGDIKEHVKFVSNIVDIISSFADDEEISIFSLQYLTKEIYLLKHLLRSTYDKLPWEEIELYLLCFIISETQQHDLKACYKAILKKSELIKFLKNFSSILKKIQIEEVGELLKLPDLKRSAVVDKIIENCPDFKTLYNKFDHIRDIYSLYKISEYAKLIHSKQPQEKGAKKIIIRVICMISQHLKNTLIAPKLSAFTANFILLSVSDKLRRTILNFIDSTSYRETFKYKLKLDKNFYKTLQTIRNDVDQIGEIADELLLRHYIRLFTQKYEETAFKSIVEEIDNTFSIALCVDKQFKRLHITDTPCFVENLIDNLNEVKSFLPEDNPIRVQLENIIKTKPIPKNYWQGKPAYARIMKGGRVDERKLFLQYVSLNLNIDEVQDILRIVEFMKSHNRKESDKNKIEKLCAETMNLLMFDANIDIRNLFDTNTLQEYFIVRDKVETYSTNYHDYLSQSRQELGNILQKSSYKKLKTENKTLELMKSLILDIIMVNEILNSGNGHENDPNLHSMLIDYLESDYELNALFFDSVMATFLIAQTFTQEDPKHIISTRSNESKYSREKNTFLDNFVTIAKKQRIFSKVAKGDLDIFTEENAHIRTRDFENSTYLHIAVKMCNNQQISNLCNQGLSFNCKNINLFTPLHTAAKNGNDEVVLHIVKKTKSLIDQVDDFGRTALHMAVLNGHNDTVKILIESGSNPFLKDHLGFTALIYAVICKNEGTLKLFQLQKEKLARHILESRDMRNLFIRAIAMNLLEIVEILLNGNLLKLDAINKAVAIHTAVHNGRLEILQVLLRCDFNPNCSIRGSTPLHIAVQQGQKHMIPTLRNAGADPFVKDNAGKSSFSYALSDGKKEILLSSLLSDNRNECSKEIDLENLFNIAIKQNDIDLVKGLLSQKLVKLDVKSQTFAICSAVFNGQIEILETLLRHDVDPNNDIDGRAPMEWKCDVNIRNPKDGKTALHYAASNGSESIIHCLLNHPSININPTDLEAQTPLHMAVEHSHLNTVEILLSRKDINVNALNSKMYTPLHIAAEKGDINIVKLLIEKWAIVDSADFSVSPLQLATENGHDEIAELLSLFQKLHTKLQRTKSSIG